MKRPTFQVIAKSVCSINLVLKTNVKTPSVLYFALILFILFPFRFKDPIDFDEEIIIPQRPSISDLYKDVRHEWAEPDLTKSGKIVADTSSDEESNLPEDPLDLDEEMMLPQKHMVKEIYEHLPGHQHQSQEEKKSRGDAAAVEVDPPPAPGSHEMPEVAAPQHGEREEKMAEAEKDVTVGISCEVFVFVLFSTSILNNKLNLFVCRRWKVWKSMASLVLALVLSFLGSLPKTALVLTLVHVQLNSKNPEQLKMR